MRQSPVPGFYQRRVRCKRRSDLGLALSNPHRKHKRLSGPVLPNLAEVVGVRISLSMHRAEKQRSVANNETGIGTVGISGYDVAQLRTAGNELWLCMPHMLEEELEKGKAGH